MDRRRLFEWWMALRYLRARQKERFISLISLISVGGIAVGVMALIVVLSVMNGLQESMRDKILGITNDLVVTALEGDLKNPDRVVNYLEARPDVVAAAPFVTGQAMLTGGDNSRGVVIRGIDPAAEARVSRLGQYMKEGRLADLAAERFSVVLGHSLAVSLGVEVGDTLSLTVAEGPSTVGGRLPRSRPFKVVGTFDSGFYEYDHNLAYLSLEVSKILFRTGENVSGVAAHLVDIDQAGHIAQQVQGELGFAYWVRDWMKMHRSFFQALATEKVVMAVILALIVWVAAFNIVSTLIMVVFEKSRAIAILMTMGATPGMILRIFMLNGLFMGISGSLIGLGLGVWLAAHVQEVVAWASTVLGIEFIPAEVYFVDELPSRIEQSDVLTILAGSILISFLATLYPSWRASKVDPVEVLRYE